MAAASYLSDSLDLNKSSSSDQSLSDRSSNRSLRVAEKERRKKEAKDPFVLAVKYFSDVKAGTPVIGNDVVERNLVVVEAVAHSKGLPPEAISVMLEFAMSLRMGTSLCARVLKCLIPATVVPQEAVVRAVGWLGVSKIPTSTQVLFIKWVLTVFDMIDAKDKLRAIYGFIFSYVRDENLCPYICHLLYLLTTKQNVQVFRVRKLLELQTKLGRQPFLLHLLSLYKVFCPELVTLSVPSRMRSGFRNHNSPWKCALALVQKKNGVLLDPNAGVTLTVKDQSKSRKRKHCRLELVKLSCALNKESQTESSSSTKLVPLAQLRTFAELLENMHRIELPAQMGSLLSTSVALHYLDCVQDESALLRLNLWLGYVLQEDFLFCQDGGTSQNSDKALHFLSRLLMANQFLQEGFSSSEAFLYKFLTVWDGFLMRPQILGLLSNIYVVPSHKMGTLLFEPLKQLYFTSSLFFKCGLLECLNNMLRKWLTWHSVYALEDDMDISINSHTSIHITLSGFKDSVFQLVQFVGHLATVGLQVESCHTLLLNFVLEFYETVCDMFLQYGLPLIVIPPPGVFYPALLATDPVSVDRLAYIMYKYKVNLAFYKSQEKIIKSLPSSRQTVIDFNHYQVDMVNYLWNGKMFLSVNLQLNEKLFGSSKVPDCAKSFDLVHHPAFMGYAVDFHRKHWPSRRDLDLHSIKGTNVWDRYLEYLFSQGYKGLKHFVQTNTKLPSRSREDSVASEA
ncbi:centromere protein I [Corythoichthys intestinalis]|uniref:centromere protein I n=1 Tax=Corythoichthys intestinalis TaxID=161448 RepID=UPI0025A5BE79|nr:centromere protein I [Corythoichthys intestinalis]XP_061793216.1 centromere protein I-like [Nerophis lumbriciformis]